MKSGLKVLVVVRSFSPPLGSIEVRGCRLLSQHRIGEVAVSNLLNGRRAVENGDVRKKLCCLFQAWQIQMWGLPAGWHLLLRARVPEESLEERPQGYLSEAFPHDCSCGLHLDLWRG